MSKLRILRQSGTPVNVEDQEKYVEAYRAMFDACELRATKILENNKRIKAPRMITLQRLIRFCERSLVKRFNGTVEVELPKSTKAWITLLERYSDIPVLVAREQESGKPLLIIMDTLGQ